MNSTPKMKDSTFDGLINLNMVYIYEHTIVYIYYVESAYLGTTVGSG